MKSLEIRVFNENGIERFRSLLESASKIPDQGLVEEAESLACNGNFTRTLGIGSVDAGMTFISKMEASKYLADCLRPISSDAVGNDELVRGLWSWLSAIYLEQLCRRREDGSLKVGNVCRYIPDPEWNNHYRHLLYGPYRVYLAHGGRIGRVLLLSKPSSQAEVYEQFAGRRDFIENPVVLEVLDRLYLTADASGVKKGAGGKGPGSARRLARVLNQFAVTYDLLSMDPDDLISLLPEEFGRFLH